jgi:hypothetical protein
MADIQETAGANEIRSGQVPPHIIRWRVQELLVRRLHWKYPISQRENMRVSVNADAQLTRLIDTFEEKVLDASATRSMDELKLIGGELDDFLNSYMSDEWEDDICTDTEAGLEQFFRQCSILTTSPYYEPRFSKFEPFLFLDDVIREVIYGFAMEGHPTAVTVYFWNHPTALHVPKWLPNVCLTSKSVYAEAVPVFLRRAAITFRGIDSFLQMEKFLTRCTNFFAALRSVYIRIEDTADGVAYNFAGSAVDFIRKCQGLHYLCIALDLRGGPRFINARSYAVITTREGEKFFLDRARMALENVLEPTEAGETVLIHLRRIDVLLPQRKKLPGREDLFEDFKGQGQALQAQLRARGEVRRMRFLWCL